MIPEPLPMWLQTQTTRLHNAGLFSSPSHQINHVLVNEYLPGQGIMSHVDGPLFSPLIATLNLGSGCTLNFKTRDPDTDSLVDQFSLFLEEGSLLVQSGEVYENYLHGIEEVDEDVIGQEVANLHHCPWLNVGDTVRRDTRISLTIRNVPKVSKFQLRL